MSNPRKHLLAALSILHFCGGAIFLLCFLLLSIWARADYLALLGAINLSWGMALYLFFARKNGFRANLSGRSPRCFSASMVLFLLSLPVMVLAIDAAVVEYVILANDEYRFSGKQNGKDVSLGVSTDLSRAWIITDGERFSLPKMNDEVDTFALPDDLRALWANGEDSSPWIPCIHVLDWSIRIGGLPGGGKGLPYRAVYWNLSKPSDDFYNHKPAYMLRRTVRKAYERIRFQANLFLTDPDNIDLWPVFSLDNVGWELYAELEKDLLIFGPLTKVDIPYADYMSNDPNAGEIAYELLWEGEVVDTWSRSLRITSDKRSNYDDKVISKPKGVDVDHPLRLRATIVLLGGNIVVETIVSDKYFWRSGETF